MSCEETVEKLSRLSREAREAYTADGTNQKRKKYGMLLYLKASQITTALEATCEDSPGKYGHGGGLLRNDMGSIRDVAKKRTGEITERLERFIETNRR